MGKYECRALDESGRCYHRATVDDVVPQAAAETFVKMMDTGVETFFDNREDRALILVSAFNENSFRVFNVVIERKTEYLAYEDITYEDITRLYDTDTDKLTAC